MKAKTLIFDIETTPIKGYTWSIWNQNVIEVVEDWYMLCFSYKWLGEKKTYVKSLPDYAGYKKDLSNDKKLCMDLHKLFSQADCVIAHNGAAFDVKKSNARFLYNGLPPYSPFRTIDTLKIARKNFKITSNKLDYLAQFLGCSRKVKHSGFPTWTGCMEGNMKSWKEMTKYAKQDTLVLEEVWNKLKPWADGFNLGLYEDSQLDLCPVCAGPNLIKRGYAHTKTRKYRQYHCKDCGKWSRSTMSEKDKGVKIV